MDKQVSIISRLITLTKHIKGVTLFVLGPAIVSATVMDNT